MAFVLILVFGFCYWLFMRGCASWPSTSLTCASAPLPPRWLGRLCRSFWLRSLAACVELARLNAQPCVGTRRRAAVSAPIGVIEQITYSTGAFPHFLLGLTHSGRVEVGKYGRGYLYVRPVSFLRKAPPTDGVIRSTDAKNKRYWPVHGCGC